MLQSLEKRLTIFNPSKLMILKALYECESPLCGCDMVEDLHLPKNLLSYHLAMLEQFGLVEAVRCGRKKNYCVRAESRGRVRKILEVTDLI